MICSSGGCQNKGPVCPICLVYDHSDHLEKAGDLRRFFIEIKKLIDKPRPESEDIKNILDDFKSFVTQKKKEIKELVQ